MVAQVQVSAKLPNARNASEMHAFGNGTLKELKDRTNAVLIFDGSKLRLEVLSASVSGLQCVP
jgi:hypothetical protein